MKHVEFFNPGTIRVTWNPFHVLSTTNTAVGTPISSPQNNVSYIVRLFKCNSDSYDCRDDSNGQQQIAEVEVKQSDQSLLKNGNKYTYIVSDYTGDVSPNDYIIAKVYSSSQKFNINYGSEMIPLEVVDVRFSTDSSEQIGYQMEYQSCSSNEDCENRFDSLFCDETEKICKPKQTQGNSCYGNVDCVTGLFCYDPTDSGVGTCQGYQYDPRECYYNAGDNVEYKPAWSVCHFNQSADSGYKKRLTTVTPQKDGGSIGNCPGSLANLWENHSTDFETSIEKKSIQCTKNVNNWSCVETIPCGAVTDPCNDTSDCLTGLMCNETNYICEDENYCISETLDVNQDSPNYYWEKSGNPYTCTKEGRKIDLGLKHIIRDNPLDDDCFYGNETLHSEYGGFVHFASFNCSNMQNTTYATGYETVNPINQDTPSTPTQTFEGCKTTDNFLCDVENECNSNDDCKSNLFCNENECTTCEDAYDIIPIGECQPNGTQEREYKLKNGFESIIDARCQIQTLVAPESVGCQIQQGGSCDITSDFCENDLVCMYDDAQYSYENDTIIETQSRIASCRKNIDQDCEGDYVNTGECEINTRNNASDFMCTVDGRYGVQQQRWEVEKPPQGTGNLCSTRYSDVFDNETLRENVCSYTGPVRCAIGQFCKSNDDCVDDYECGIGNLCVSGTPEYDLLIQIFGDDDKTINYFKNNASTNMENVRDAIFKGASQKKYWDRSERPVNNLYDDTYGSTETIKTFGSYSASDLQHIYDDRVQSDTSIDEFWVQLDRYINGGLVIFDELPPRKHSGLIIDDDQFDSNYGILMYNTHNGWNGAGNTKGLTRTAVYMHQNSQNSHMMYDQEGIFMCTQTVDPTYKSLDNLDLDLDLYDLRECNYNGMVSYQWQDNDLYLDPFTTLGTDGNSSKKLLTMRVLNQFYNLSPLHLLFGDGDHWNMHIRLPYFSTPGTENIEKNNITFFDIDDWTDWSTTMANRDDANRLNIGHFDMSGHTNATLGRRRSVGVQSEFPEDNMYYKFFDNATNTYFTLLSTDDNLIEVNDTQQGHTNLYELKSANHDSLETLFITQKTIGGVPYVSLFKITENGNFKYVYIDAEEDNTIKYKTKYHWEDDIVFSLETFSRSLNTGDLCEHAYQCTQKPGLMCANIDNQFSCYTSQEASNACGENRRYDRTINECITDYSSFYLQSMNTTKSCIHADTSWSSGGATAGLCDGGATWKYNTDNKQLILDSDDASPICLAVKDEERLIVTDCTLTNDRFDMSYGAGQNENNIKVNDDKCVSMYYDANLFLRLEDCNTDDEQTTFNIVNSSESSDGLHPPKWYTLQTPALPNMTLGFRNRHLALSNTNDSVITRVDGNDPIYVNSNLTKWMYSDRKLINKQTPTKGLYAYASKGNTVYVKNAPFGANPGTEYEWIKDHISRFFNVYYKKYLHVNSNGVATLRDQAGGVGRRGQLPYQFELSDEVYDVDCEYIPTESNCDATCGTGTQTITYDIMTYPSGDGAECPESRTQSCDTGVTCEIPMGGLCGPGRTCSPMITYSLKRRSSVGNWWSYNLPEVVYHTHPRECRHENKCYTQNEATIHCQKTNEFAEWSDEDNDCVIDYSPFKSCSSNDECFGDDLECKGGICSNEQMRNDLCVQGNFGYPAIFDEDTQSCAPEVQIVSQHKGDDDRMQCLAKYGQWVKWKDCSTYDIDQMWYWNGDHLKSKQNTNECIAVASFGTTILADCAIAQKTIVDDDKIKFTNESCVNDQNTSPASLSHSLFEYVETTDCSNVNNVSLYRPLSSDGEYQMHISDPSGAKACSKAPGNDQRLTCGASRSDRFRVNEEGISSYRLKSVSHGASVNNWTNSGCWLKNTGSLLCDDDSNRYPHPWNIEQSGGHDSSNNNEYTIRYHDNMYCNEATTNGVEVIKCSYYNPTSFFNFTKNPPPDDWCTDNGSTFEYVPGCGYTCISSDGSQRGIYGVQNAEWPNAPLESCPVAFGGSGSGMSFNKV